MSAYEAHVNVMLKSGISDPQGQTIERALPALGYDGVSDVRVGKRITLSVEADGPEDATSKVTQMCERLLANPVIESFDVTLGRREGT
jgi:phosphoribosylformylglycinamidine synthase